MRNMQNSDEFNYPTEKQEDVEKYIRECERQITMWSEKRDHAIRHLQRYYLVIKKKEGTNEAWV